jgi:hypothetical protein
MNGIEGFVIGMIVGIVSTFTGIMLFTKYMTRKQKELYKQAGLDKLLAK